MQVIAQAYTPLSLAGSGYIAGKGDGIVTVKGQPATRKLYLFNVTTLELEQTVISSKGGRYIFIGLDLTKQYLLMARDHKKEFEPFAWDYVTPADDLTIDEQQALWQSWETN